MNRGFFSAFVGLFAVALLISVFYAQSIRNDTEARANELGVIQQQLSKDWFLARNAYTNFAADAILKSIENQYGPSSVNCNAATIQGLDYASEVEAYWDQTTLFLAASYGVNCDVNLSTEVYNTLEQDTIPAAFVKDDLRAYGLLTCTRSGAYTTLSYMHPFVIRKDVRVTAVPGVSCKVEVYDHLGEHSDPDPKFNISYEKLDVNWTYP